MKKQILSFLTIILVLCANQSYAQKFEQRQLGNVTLDELKMTHYKLDSTAKAVVLEDFGHVYFLRRYASTHTFLKYTLRADFYVKIKVFKKTDRDYGLLDFPFSDNSKVKFIEGVTYNLNDKGEIEKTKLNPEDIIEKKIHRNYKRKSLALPNIKDGSIIEYKFSIFTNNYGIYDWNYQQDLPVVKSIYKGKVNFKHKYNIKRTGKFSNGNLITEIRRNCVEIIKCLAVEHTMTNIPAFKSEQFMLADKNYRATLQFERNYLNAFTSGENRNWKSVDKILKNYYGFKANEASETKSKLPSYLFTEQDDLKRAKEIYYYIQSNYKSWNTSKIYSSGRSINKTLNEKNGSRSNINFILFNALKAAKLNPEMVFLSTRDELIVSKLHASLVDFNHIIVKLQLNGKDYFLDPSYKNLPFGLPSFMSLNGDGRAFNFKNYSQWTSIYPTAKSSISKTTDLLVKKDGTISGKLIVKTTGYNSQHARNNYFKDNEESYLEAFETQYSNVIVKNYTNNNSKNLDKPFIETFDIEIEEEEDTFDKIVLPVFSSFISNPFQLEKREYAINFGYARDYTYRIQLRFEDNVKFKRLPKNFGYKLPNNGGRLIFSVAQGENKVNIYLKLSLKKSSYPALEYEYLKEFFSKFIEKKNEYIQLED